MTKLLLLFAALSFVFPLLAHAQDSPLKQPAEYSVEMVVFSSGAETGSKMYKVKDKTRVESGEGKSQSVTIKRADLGKMYLIATPLKMYVESTYTAEGDADVMAPAGKMKWERIGSEMAHGVACEKYKVTMKFPGQTNEMIYFVDSQGYPARTEMTIEGQTIAVDYKNWTEGPQNAALFEVPAGYTKR